MGSSVTVISHFRHTWLFKKILIVDSLKLQVTFKLRVSYQGTALLLCLSGAMLWSEVIKVSFVPNSLFIVLSTPLNYSTAEAF